MIQLQQKSTITDTLPVMKQVRYTLDTNSTEYIESSLRDLYANPVAAVVREYLSNALDAHRRIGQKCPIDIDLPGAFNSEFSIRDYGPGIPLEETEDRYFNFGYSDKRRTNKEIGTRGMGCKCGFALSDTFTVEIWNAGVKQVWIAGQDHEGRSVATLMCTEPSDEPSGLRFAIPIKEQDFTAVEDQVAFHTRWVRDVPLNIRGSLRKSREDKVKVDIPVGSVPGFPEVWAQVYESGYNEAKVTVVAGGIPTSVQNRALSNLYRLYGKKSTEENMDKILCYSYSVAVGLPVGSFNLTPSRDSVKEDEATARALIPRLDAVVESVTQHLCKCIVSTPLEWTPQWASKARHEMDRSDVLSYSANKSRDAVGTAISNLYGKYAQKFGHPSSYVAGAGTLSLGQRTTRRRDVVPTYEWQSQVGSIVINVEKCDYHDKMLLKPVIRYGDRAALVLDNVDAVLVLEESEMTKKLVKRKRMKDILTQLKKDVKKDEVLILVLPFNRNKDSDTTLEEAKALANGKIKVIDGSAWYLRKPRRYFRSLYSKDGVRTTVSNLSVITEKQTLADDPGIFLVFDKEELEDSRIVGLMRAFSMDRPYGARVVLAPDRWGMDRIYTGDRPRITEPSAEQAMLKRLMAWYGDDKTFKMLATYFIESYRTLASAVALYRRDTYEGRCSQAWRNVLKLVEKIESEAGAQDDRTREVVYALDAYKGLYGTLPLQMLANEWHLKFRQAYKDLDVLDHVSVNTMRAMARKYRIQLLYKGVK